jgi:hypothetical protein
MSDIIMIPYYSLTPSQITLFERPDITRFSVKQISTFENLKDNENKYQELSTHSRKRIKRSIDFLLYITKNKSILGQQFKSKYIETEIVKDTGELHKNKINFKLTFITLTLSAKQHNTDEEIKSKLLNNFLTTARRSWKMKDYIWKAEKQENGNIHFHILTNVYIKHLDIRKVWNSIQNKSGFNYVDIYSKNMQEFFKNGFKSFPNDKRTKEKQLAVYEENKLINWTNPNSTDIHALYKIRNISAYMSKYLAKSVTKTDRVEQLENLYSKLETLQNQLITNETTKLFDPEFDHLQETLKLQIEPIKAEIEVLKNKGVSGRIWSQSQSLSSFSNFVDCQPWERIPDIEYILQNHEYCNEIECGQSKVITYKFDIEKTLKLKEVLDNHLKTLMI